MAANYSVIVATYNEADNLPILFEQIHSAFEQAREKSFEIVVVDDNSPDGTGKVVRQLQDVFPETTIQIVERPGKLGLGTAYIEGLKHCKGQFVFILDADLSHQPRFIPDMIEMQKKGDYDIVSGTRYSNGGGVVGWPFKRRLISCLSNQVVAALFSPPATDVTGSFRLYKKSALQDICAEMNSVGYSFQCEAILRATRMGLKIANVPIEFVDRVYGESCFSKSSSLLSQPFLLDVQEAKQFLMNLVKLVWTL